MIKELYDEVFDSNGNVKLCGREKCKKLIDACKNAYKGVDFGDSETGYMNIDNIKKYVKQEV